MLKKILIAAALALAAGSASAVARVGEAAPAFSLPDSNGKTVSLADFRGKTVVLEWTNDQCPFVRKHYGSGNMQSLQKYATGKGAVWLSIISSAPGKEGYITGAEANTLTKTRGAAPSAVLLDGNGAVGHAYGAKTTPHMFVIDPAGKLVYMGGIDSIASADPDDIKSATPYVKVALDESMAGKPVSHAVTAPYGCGVHY